MSIADEIQKLESLRASGAITEPEFAAAKARILDATPPVPAPAAGGETNFLHRLTRSSTDVWLGGVCGGLGQFTTIPSWTWRLIFVLLLFGFGVGIIPYVLMWIFIPSDDAST